MTDTLPLREQIAHCIREAYLAGAEFGSFGAETRANIFAANVIANLTIPPLPDGLVAVPLEPTEEMEDAGRYRDAKEGESIYAAIYRAMLAARPTHSTAGD